MTAVILTGVGRRYDIVSTFAEHATVVAVDPNPLAPAPYAAQVRRSAPPFGHPEYLPAIRALRDEFGAKAILPLTDLDIELLGEADDLPAFVSAPGIARQTFDKLACHELLLKHGLPSPPTVAGEELDAVEDFPVVVKPRRGSNSRGIHFARDRAQAQFFVSYLEEPAVVQTQLGGFHVALDCLGDLDGRCLNVIPREMIESRGGEVVKGRIVDDGDLLDLGRRTMEALRVRGPGMIQAFRDPEHGLGIHDVNLRFGGGYPGLVLGALPGRTYPELIVRMAEGERIEPHVGALRAGVHFTRFYWQLELDAELEPTGRDIVDPPGPRLPSA